MELSGTKNSRFSRTFRVFTAFVCFCFLYEIIATDILRIQSTFAHAQMNAPANLVMPSAAFLPPALKAIHIDPQSPSEIDFIIDGADQSKVHPADVSKLVQYFLATMTTPEKDIWVNLSPYESKRIIAPQFGETSAGRELLLQDQLLKQLAASLTYPESDTGKVFWDRVYQKAVAMYGTTAIPIDTFQRVWIMPNKAVVYEYNGTAFITESRLKVLLEDDYLALKNAQKTENLKGLSEDEAQKVNNFSSEVTREIVLPEIEKEINEGKNFAALRQIYHALILATWFKKKLKQHILSRSYVDLKKVKGIEDDTDQTAEKIYQQYIQVLKEGVYKYVREDFDASSQSVIPRQYFSGGFAIGNTREWLDIRPISNILISSRKFLEQLGKKLTFAKIRLQPLGAGGELSLPGVVKSNPVLKRKSMLSKWMAGLLAGVVLGSASQGVIDSPLMQDTSALAQSQIVSVEDLDLIENTPKEVREVKKDSAPWEQLAKKVTLEDVLELNGKINKFTGKPYKIDAEYFRNNWKKIFSDGSPRWVEEVIVLAYQHKLGIAEDGKVGPQTRALLQMEPKVTVPDNDMLKVQLSNVLKLGQPISVEQSKYFEALAKIVSIEDVFALSKVTNPQTGKAYQIDEDYFTRNWDNLFVGRRYDWPQQTLVIAAQNKLNLKQDNHMGPETQKAIMEVVAKEQEKVIVATPPQPEEKKATASPPPPDKKQKETFAKDQDIKKASPWFTQMRSYFSSFNNTLFEILLVALISLQTLRIYRDSKNNLSDRVDLLRLLTKYLQGDANHPFSTQTVHLISKQTSLSDMTARVVGNHVELIIRSTNSLQGRSDDKKSFATEEAIRNAIQNGDFHLMLGSKIMKFKRLSRYETRIHLLFEIPAEEKANAKGIAVYYRGTDRQLKSFKMPVSEDRFKELEEAWEVKLKNSDYLSENDLKELVAMISFYRQHNPPAFKDFRHQSVVAFKIRMLSAETLRKLKGQNISLIYRDYFYHLGQYANMIRYLMGQSATLDNYKSSFLPDNDRLNFKIAGLSIDKIYRVVTLVEHAYSQALKNVRNRLFELYSRCKVLDQFEIQMQQELQDEGSELVWEHAQKQEYNVGSLRSEFDQFSLSFEKPYAHSIVGLDLFRRHNKVIKSIKDILFLLSPFILWSIFGSSLSIWVPFLAGVGVFWVVNYLAPQLSQYLTFYEYRKFSGILGNFKPEEIPEDFASPTLNKDELLNYATEKFLPKTRWSDSRFVLAATRFSDVKVIRENSYVEIRFIADNDFMVPYGQEESVLLEINEAIKTGSLAFRLNMNDEVSEIDSERIVIYVHPTGLRLRIKNVNVAADSIDFLYNGDGPDRRKSYILKIMNDPFKQLINQWGHLMDDMKKEDFSGLDALVVSIKDFHKPGNMNLTDFRKNAGFYHLIRERAFLMYETLVVNGGRAVDPRYRQYFLELARYATEVRFLSASFAGVDALKLWYVSDGDLFRRKIFGVPISRTLRAIFGVSFLYSWARADTLKSIQRVSQQWEVLDRVQNSIVKDADKNQNTVQSIEGKLKVELEKADFSFRYPEKNSLVGSDKYNRAFGMWTMLAYFATLILTVSVIALPFVITAVNFVTVWLGGGPVIGDSALVAFLNQPQFFGLSIVNFSVVFYVIAYWINPIHGNNAMQRERTSYLRIIESYEQQSSQGEMKTLQNKYMLESFWSQAFYYLSYVLGIFSPTVIMGYFLYQQVQSKFWKNETGNGNGNGQTKVIATGGPPVKKDVVLGGPKEKDLEEQQKGSNNPGGIDLQVDHKIQFTGEGSAVWGAVMETDALFHEMQGLDFKILELTPIINIPLFLPNFVRGNGMASVPPQLLSLNSP